MEWQPSVKMWFGYLLNKVKKRKKKKDIYHIEPQNSSIPLTSLNWTNNQTIKYKNIMKLDYINFEYLT